jgi:hypothetical protein
MRWYTRIGRRVWPHEIRNFLFRDRRTKNGPTVRQFWGAPQDDEEASMRIPPRVQAARQVVPMTAGGMLDRRAIRLRRD